MPDSLREFVPPVPEPVREVFYVPAPEPMPDTSKNPEIVNAYDKVKDALSKGDWNDMGKALEELEIEINKLR